MYVGRVNGCRVLGRFRQFPLKAEQVVAASVRLLHAIVGPVGGKISVFPKKRIEGEVEVVILRIEGHAHVGNLLPAAQCARTIEDVVVPDAEMFVGTEIEHPFVLVVEGRHLIALCVDGRTGVDRRLVVAVLYNGIPDVQSANALLAVGNEVEHVHVVCFHQKGL